MQGLTHFQSRTQPDIELRALTTRGGRPFCGAGQIFKSEGWLDSQVHVIWQAAYDEPWCLISDVPQLTGHEYRTRNWQEQSFRDLKSGGWRWNDSQVWLPDHAERLLLVLALTLSLGLRLLAALNRLNEPIRLYLDFRQPLSPLALSGWLS